MLADEKAERRLLGGGERFGEGRRLGRDRRRHEARLGHVHRRRSVVVGSSRGGVGARCHVGGKYHQVAATIKPKRE